MAAEIDEICRLILGLQARETGNDVPSATTLGVPAAPGSSWELDLSSVVESAL
jgi:hypothetical protein